MLVVLPRCTDRLVRATLFIFTVKVGVFLITEMVKLVVFAAMLFVSGWLTVIVVSPKVVAVITPVEAL